MTDYNFNYQDRIQKSYLQKGPCQPTDHKFPQTIINNRLRRFNPSWFTTYPS